MILNALEATDKSKAIKLDFELMNEYITFKIWNENAIPLQISKRIFQRNFTTKSKIGRGLGTYSMKMFGEKVLGGSVDFKTSLEHGTTFRFTQKIKL